MSEFVPVAHVKVGGVVGTGSVGASWIALLLAHDIDVLAHDPAPQAEGRARKFVANAWPALRALGIAQAEVAPLARLRFAGSAREVAQAADLIQENAPGRMRTSRAVCRDASLQSGASDSPGGSGGRKAHES